MTNLLRDAAFGLRLLRRNPASSVIAVGTLALGIAATTSIFSVVYATYLAPLPYRDADRLVMVWSRFEGQRRNVSPADFLDWKRQATAFEDLNAWDGREVNLSVDQRPEQVLASPATPGFLSMLGYGHPLALGRTFVPQEGAAGQDQVVVLTHRLWRQRFAGDPRIVGRQIRIDQKPYTVVGVLGAGPADENMVRLWLPLAFTPEMLERRTQRSMLVMGRLKPGVAVEQANAEMTAVMRTLAATYPESNAGWTASVEPFRNNFVRDETKTALWLLLGAVAFVLLIACANVANLLLARGTARQRELALRASLGASRGAIVQQFLTESVVLALVGGALGIVLAYALVDVIVALLPPFTLPTEVDIRLSVPVLLFTAAASVLSAILFGLAPAWHAGRTDLGEALKQGGRSVGGGTDRLRRALVVLEFALALSLLTAGGLAIQSFFNLARMPLGLRADHLLTFSLPVTEGRLAKADRIDAFYWDLLERVQALPGVASASVSTGLPLRWATGSDFSIPGRPRDSGQRRFVGLNRVSPEYFGTLGVRITRGRGFDGQDRAGSQPVAIVNEAFVKRYLAGADPLTQAVVLEERDGGGPPTGAPVARQIVGVSADVRGGGPRNDTWPAIDIPFSQSPREQASMAVRTAGDPAGMQPAVAAVVASLDRDLPLGSPKTMEQVVSETIADDRFNMALFATFAAVALVLAAVGIYGVMTFVVAQRTREIGVRMALGARRGEVLGQVLRDGMKTAMAGLVFGSAGAYFVTQAMRGMLPGAGAVSATAFVGVALTLLGSAFVACLVPARRAASVDPMVVLRQE
jgi:putative ABC transport system permease protein